MGCGRVAVIQFRNVFGVIARSRAIAGIVSGDVRERRTASALNSGLYVGRRRWAIWDSSAHSAPSEVSTETTQLQYEAERRRSTFFTFFTFLSFEF